MKREFLKLNIYEWLFVIIVYAVIITLSIIYKNYYLEVIATLLGILSSVLNIKKNRVAFIVFAIYSIVYAYTCNKARIYGEAILYSCINFPLYLISIYRLFIKKSSQEELKQESNTISWKYWVAFIILIPSITVGYGYLLKHLNSDYPFWNAAATSVALISNFLASNKKKEQWFFWLSYGFILIYVWAMKASYCISNNLEVSGLVYLVLNIVYIILDSYGMYHWFKKDKQNI